jgi:hypothetical protein
MRIIANVRGAFLEPVGGFGVRDAVSFLQLQAHVPEEALLLQQVYRVLRDGGTIRVAANSDRIGVQCEFATDAETTPALNALAPFPSEPDAQAAAPSPEPQHSPQVEGVTPALTGEIPLPVVEGKHMHVFSTNVNCVHEPDGIWLGCECGYWEYFPRLILSGELEEKENESKRKPN